METKIAVVGLGLIGGSLLKSLKREGFYLIGVSKSEATIQKVFDEGLADEVSTDYDVLSKADIVFVCTPMNCIIDTIDKVADFAKEGAIITDAASIKGFIIDYVSSLAEKINFIGGHPMAGTENKGINSAEDGLFEGAKWVLTPLETTSGEDLQKLSSIIEKIGAIPVVTDAQSHDKAVALISHIPMLISQSLFKTASVLDDLTLSLASSGFRDTTRLAMTNLEMAKDMLEYNGDNIRKYFSDFCSNTEELIARYPDFIEELEVNVQKRKDMYSEDGKNIYKQNS